MDLGYRTSHISRKAFGENSSRRSENTLAELSPSEDREAKRTRRIARLLSLEAAFNDEAWLNSKAPPDPGGVVPYLLLFGRKAASPWSWAPSNSVPQFDFRVTEHAEINEHTWYLIECSLRFPDEGYVDEKGNEKEDSVHWETARRLCHVRELLYDHVKSNLGDSYNLHFAGAHFAHRGGIVGTTSRLSTWFQALAATVNSGAATPYLIALTLNFLDAPHLHAIDAAVSAAVVGTGSALLAAMNGKRHSGTVPQEILLNARSKPNDGLVSTKLSAIGGNHMLDPVQCSRLSSKDSEKIDNSMTSSANGSVMVQASVDIDSPSLFAVRASDMLDPFDIDMEIQDEDIVFPLPDPLENEDSQVEEFNQYVDDDIAVCVEGGLQNPCRVQNRLSDDMQLRCSQEAPESFPARPQEKEEGLGNSATEGLKRSI